MIRTTAKRCALAGVLAALVARASSEHGLADAHAHTQAAGVDATTLTPFLRNLAHTLTPAGTHTLAESGRPILPSAEELAAFARTHLHTHTHTHAATSTRPLGIDPRTGEKETGQCAFTQPCSSYLTPGCHPVNITDPAGLAPVPMAFPNPACPQYADAACCNEFQNTDLTFNFILIGAAFGPPGGCEACVRDLYDFWCAFTCSPRQSEFVHVLGLAFMPDPNNGNKNTTVLETSMKVDPHYACALFSACKGTGIAEAAGLSICEQFIDFQAKQSAIGKGSYTDVVYTKPSDDPTTLSLGYYDCCSFPANFSNPDGGNTSCPCATCAGMCGTEQCFMAGAGGANATDTAVVDTPDIGVLNGFYAPVVIGLYAALAAVSILAVGFQSGLCARKSDAAVLT